MEFSSSISSVLDSKWEDLQMEFFSWRTPYVLRMNLKELSAFKGPLSFYLLVV